MSFSILVVVMFDTESRAASKIQEALIVGTGAQHHVGFVLSNIFCHNLCGTALSARQDAFLTT